MQPTMQDFIENDEISLMRLITVSLTAAATLLVAMLKPKFPGQGQTVHQ